MGVRETGNHDWGGGIGVWELGFQRIGLGWLQILVLALGLIRLTSQLLKLVQSSFHPAFHEFSSSVQSMVPKTGSIIFPSRMLWSDICFLISAVVLIFFPGALFFFKISNYAWQIY